MYVTYISHPWRWPHGWPKLVGNHYVYKLISIYLCAFAGTIIVYMYSNKAWIMDHIKSKIIWVHNFFIVIFQHQHLQAAVSVCQNDNWKINCVLKIMNYWNIWVEVFSHGKICWIWSRNTGNCVLSMSQHIFSVNSSPPVNHAHSKLLPQEFLW